MARVVSQVLKQCAAALQRGGTQLSVTTLGTSTSPVAGFLPEGTKAAFVAPTAYLASDVGENAAVWYSSTVVGSTVGTGASILDGAVVKGCVLGADVVVGANAVLKNVRLETGSVVGNGAALSDVSVGAKATVAPGAKLEAAAIPKGELWAGIPAAYVETVEPKVPEPVGMAEVHRAETSKLYQVLLVEEEDYWDASHRSADYHKRLDDTDDIAVADGRVPGRILNSPLTTPTTSKQE